MPERESDRESEVQGEKAKSKMKINCDGQGRWRALCAIKVQ